MQLDNIYSVASYKFDNITIGAGWTNEIPILNQENEIKIIITNNEDNLPIENALNDVDISLTNGDFEEEIVVNEDKENPGMYVIDLIPTKIGNYLLNLKGTILNDEINERIPLEKVKEITETAFPLMPTFSTGNNTPSSLPTTTNLTTSEMTPLTTTNETAIDQENELLSFSAANESSPIDNLTTTSTPSSTTTPTNLTTSEMTPLTTTNETAIDQENELLSFSAA
ncbi:MAG: hypothetical protein R3321_12770, partial [Nitrososphaeraceae archaeon]|nr:hypothetical protein [Nitrososphaeraceae archaeon]